MIVQAKTTLLDSIPTLMTWLSKFKRLAPRQDSRVSVGWKDGRSVEEGFCVRGIMDIEESVWSPKYGLKGKIDASLEAAFVDCSTEGVMPCDTTPLYHFSPCTIDMSCLQSSVRPATIQASARRLGVQAGVSSLFSLTACNESKSHWICQGARCTCRRRSRLVRNPTLAGPASSLAISQYVTRAQPGISSSSPVAGLLWCPWSSKLASGIRATGRRQASPSKPYV